MPGIHGAACYRMLWSARWLQAWLRRNHDSRMPGEGKPTGVGPSTGPRPTRSGSGHSLKGKRGDREQRADREGPGGTRQADAGRAAEAGEVAGGTAPAQGEAGGEGSAEGLTAYTNENIAQQEAAQRAGLPAYVVLYQAGHEANPADLSQPYILMFRVRRIWPRPGGYSRPGVGRRRCCRSNAGPARSWMVWRRTIRGGEGASRGLIRISPTALG